MNVLTIDSKARSQLSILLRELGYSARFHATVDELNTALKEDANGEVVLVDVTLDTDHAALVNSFASVIGVRFIGFHCFSSTTEASMSGNSDAYKTSLFLPGHAERAKSRLKSALAPLRKQGGGTRSSFKTPSSALFKRGTTRPPFGFGNAGASIAAPLRPEYLVCASEAGRAFMSRIGAISDDDLATVLVGEDGAEFELVCREINFQKVADRTALHIFTPDEVSLTDLEVLERKAKRERSVLHVYLGRSDDYSADSLREVELFVDYLSNLRQPYLRIYIAHAYGSEELFREGVEDIFKPLTKKLRRLSLPSLSDRAADIPKLCHSTLGLLRTAHPFLLVQQISNDAIQHLVETRSDLNHSQLIRILRNSIALSKRPILCVEDIKNYGESGLTTQHLLESMADENYFPPEQSVNF